MAEILRILIVEDDDVDRMALGRMLKKTGFSLEIRECTSGILDIARLKTEAWDCIFLDYLLPKEDGITILRKIRDAGIQTPVIVLTGQGNEQVAVEVMKAGASDYIVKNRMTPQVIAQALCNVMHIYQVELEKLLALRELRESEERYRMALEFSPDAIIINSDGIISFANTAATKLFGAKNPQQLMGRAVSEIMHPDYKEATLARIKDLLEGTALVSPLVEKKMLRLDGSSVEVEARATSFVFSGKKCIYVVLRDITERKKGELKLLESRKKAERAEKLALLGTMAASIAHEINQPLNAIKVDADSLLYWHKRGKTPPLEKVMDSLQRISAQTDRINEIILNVRSLIRNDQMPESVPCNLNSSVRAAVDLLKSQLNSRGIAFSLELDEHLPPILAHQGRLEEMVINLVVNAMHALEEVNKEGKLITCWTGGENNQVVLKISDNAMGIPEEIKDKIFEPFFTGKQSGEGMGLGLSIVYSIVTSFNGVIEVTNNEIGGATFRVGFSVKEV